MTPVDVVLALLSLVAQIAPGILAAITSTATDEEAIAAARASLPLHLDTAHPDPVRDAAREARIRGADVSSPRAKAQLILATSSPAVRRALAALSKEPDE